MASKSMMAPPDPAAAKLIEPRQPPKLRHRRTPAPEVVAVGAAAPTRRNRTQPPMPQLAVQRTEFGVDVGGANSVGGLRALWRGLLKSNAALTALRPIIVVKEGNNGLGMQLRLVAGPLSDAAAAAKICAALVESQRPCETTVFDGQRLAMKADERRRSHCRRPIKPARRIKPRRKRSNRKAGQRAPSRRQNPKPPTLSSFFSRR